MDAYHILLFLQNTEIGIETGGGVKTGTKRRPV